MPWSLLRRYPLAAVALFGVVLALGLLRVAPDISRFVFGAIVVLGGAPVLFQTARDLFSGKLQTDAIAALAIVGAAVLGEYAAGAIIVLMQTGGTALEDYGIRQASKSLDNLLRRAPSLAHRRDGTGFTEVTAADVRVDDVLLIRPGDILAADGVLIEGAGNVDEAALTGEPVPLGKTTGDTVYSGTINLSGSFLYRVTSSTAQSKYERIVRMVQSAQGERAPIQRLADRYTPTFTIATLIMAGGAFALSGDPHRALAVLVVATPCPLIIATPLAVLSAINRAASRNIIAKSGAALERLGQVDAVAFDKTGTLTVGAPRLTSVHAFDTAWPEDALLQAAASVEARSAHVLAQSVVRTAQERGLVLGDAQDSRESPGKGVAATVDGRRWALGSGSFLASEGASIDDMLRARRAALSAEGQTVAYAAVDGAVVGLLVFADTLRPESPALIARLRTLGIGRILLLTGDTPEAARGIGDALGIDTVHARLQPEEKLALLDGLKRDGHTVLMVGDGINDAPALAAASVSIALGDHGAGIATDAADLVITVENVERVADAIGIGRRMVSVARQGILGGMLVSGVLMIVASLGAIPPSLGAVLQEILDLAAILNALRARR
jgi:heavy metal translocating P-type ATPase